MPNLFLPGASEGMGSFKSWSAIAAVWVTILGSLGGGIFALVQYRDRLHQEQVKETLAYVERYDQEPWRGARTGLEQLGEREAQALFREQAGGQCRLYGHTDRVLRKARQEENIRLLLAFYEKLAACTCADICDARSVGRFFGLEADDLHGFIAPYLFAQRRHLKDDNYGLALEAFARSHRRGDPALFHRAYCETGAAALPPLKAPDCP